VGAFVFSTIVITLFCEIFPQAYFARNALRMGGTTSGRCRLYPVAKPTAVILNWWLGVEGLAFLRERDFRALITKHVGVVGATSDNWKRWAR
jgi:metal transporter CNNM